MTRTSKRKIPVINRYFMMSGLLVAAIAVAVWPMQAQQPPAQGKAAYDDKCAGCHGARGEGKIGPPLVPLRHDATALLGIVRQGGSDMPGIPDCTSGGLSSGIATVRIRAGCAARTGIRARCWVKRKRRY